MITPRFKLSQTDSTVTITVRAPYSNLRELEITVDEELFIFYCSPYYLRLQLPGRLGDEESTQSSFDADSGEFTFTIRKALDGEHFPDLDLITKLLAPKIQVSDPDDGTRKITILGNEEAPKGDDELNEEFGFALCGKENFHHVSAEFSNVFEVNPYEVKLAERHKRRLQYEQGKFDIDHYLSDYIENEEILEMMKLKAPWADLQSEEIKFTDSELDFLKDLPNKQYNLSETQINFCHNSLIDVLFAFCYDRRTTDFEGTCESGWAIIKLAATFSWLDVFETPREAIVSNFRRSVIYPLYRSFDLTQAVLTDLKQLLNLGEKYLIRCLIEMHKIFLEGDCCRYILNNLFIKDYIVYVMKWDQNRWRELVAEVAAVSVTKSDLGLNLQEIEDNYVGKLSDLNIQDDDSDDTDCDSDSSSSSDSTDSASDDH